MELVNKGFIMVEVPFMGWRGLDKVALIDDEDAKLLVGRPIYFNMRNVIVKYELRKQTTLHRYVMGFPKEMVDHKNGNKLDCRKENLRLCTSSQNQANRHTGATGASGYRGVIWNGQRNMWMVKLNHDGKQIYGGLFEDPKEAARAYDKRAVELWGEFAQLNMPGY